MTKTIQSKLQRMGQRLSAQADKAAIGAAVTLLPAAAMAHPGHDHGHWASSAVHVLALLAATSVVAAGIWTVARSRRRRVAQRIERSKQD